MARISVVVGPPGTGKTTTMGEWTARAVQRYGMHKVLILALTRTAAHQAGRIIDLPWEQCSTTHGAVFRALGQPDLAESDKALKQWNEAHPTMLLTTKTLNVDDGFHRDESPDHRYDVIKHEVARMRTMGLDPLDAPSQAVLDFHLAWEDWKRQCGLLDFVDLIDTAYRECATAPGEPAVIMVDEFQDIAVTEWRLIEKWASHKTCEHLALFGDSQQSLFGWRGSNSLLLQELWLQHDRDRQPLQQSYRLAQAVYEQAYAWAGRFQDTIRIAFSPRAPGGSVERVGWSFDKLTPQAVDTIVKTYLTEESEAYYEARYEHVPLLFLATCGYMLEPLLAGLREAGIPFYNPWRPNHGGWNPLPHKRSRGLTVVDRVLAFVRPRVDVYGAEARFWSPQDFKAWAGAVKPANEVFSRGGLKAVKELSDTASDEDIARAFRTWVLPECQGSVLPVPDIDWYLSHVDGSPRLRDFVRAVIDHHGVTALRERPRVAVGTVHSTKGAQAYTTVLCPDMSAEAYTQARQDPGAAEELRRVYYVGMTRAYEHLVLTRPGSKYTVGW